MWRWMTEDSENGLLVTGLEVMSKGLTVVDGQF